MKTPNKVFLFAVLSPLLYAGCSGENDQVTGNVKTIIIKEAVNDTIRVDKGKTLQITAETTPHNQPVWYYSSNTNVFSVTTEGLISASANRGGIASLLVTAQNGMEWTRKTYVLAVMEYVESISLKNPDSRIEIALEAVFDPQSYFVIAPSTATNTNMVYISDDPSIVSVTPDGKLTGHKKGITKIAAKSADGTNIVSDKVEVEVIPLLNRTGWTGVTEFPNSSYPASNLFDGSNSTMWGNLWNGSSIPCWVVIDMKKIVAFDKIGLVQSSYSMAKDVDLYISASDVDNLSHDDPSFNAIGSIEVTATVSGESVLDFYPAEEKQARYIKLNFTSSRLGNYLSLSGLNVYYQK